MGVWGLEGTPYTRWCCIVYTGLTLYAAAVWMPHNELRMNILESWHKKFANWLPPPPLYIVSASHSTLGPGVGGGWRQALTSHSPGAKISPQSQWGDAGQVWGNLDPAWLIESTREVNRQIRYWISLFRYVFCFGLNVSFAMFPAFRCNKHLHLIIFWQISEGKNELIFSAQGMLHCVFLGYHFVINNGRCMKNSCPVEALNPVTIWGITLRLKIVVFLLSSIN